MPRGRPPRKPIALHRRDGTFRSDRHGQSMDPHFAPGLPEYPAWLARTERTIFAHLVDQLSAVPGLLTPIDSISIAALAHAAKEYHTVAQSGDSKRLDAADKQLRYWLSRFGMTPADRASFLVPIAPPSSGLSDLMKVV